MSTIIERITEAEETADKLRKEAAAEAREAILAAEVQVHSQKAKERQDGLARLREAADKAQFEGDKTAEKIMEETRVKTAALCAEARGRIPNAVTYLMERVVKA